MTTPVIETTPVVNLTLKKWEDYSATCTVTDFVTNEVIDISGWTFKADIKSRPKDTSKLASFTFSFLTDGKDGVYIRSISKEIIQTLGIHEGVWDQFYIEGGENSKMMKGSIAIENSITDLAP